MQEFTELERRLISSMKDELLRDLRAHFEDGRDICIEPYSQAFHWPGLKYDQIRVYCLLLEALGQATAEFQKELEKKMK